MNTPDKKEEVDLIYTDPSVYPSEYCAELRKRYKQIEKLKDSVKSYLRKYDDQPSKVSSSLHDALVAFRVALDKIEIQIGEIWAREWLQQDD